MERFIWFADPQKGVGGKLCRESEVTLPVTTQRDERLLAPRFDEGQNRRPLLQLVPQPR